MPKRSVKDTVIIATGGGTQKDVSNLARDLGMDATAMLEVLNSQGAGVRVSRSIAASAAATTTTSAAAPMSNAWAEFISEEGGGGLSLGTDGTNNTAKRTKTTPTKSPSSRAKAVSSSTSAAATTTAAASSLSRYKLPILPRMKIQTQTKSKTGTNKSSSNEEYEEDNNFPTPGVLGQTGTLDAACVGRKKSSLPSIQDIMEPTLLGYTSIFNKIPIALIASSSSACHSIVIDIYGDAYAWGRNESGQCGNTNGKFNPCVPMPKRIKWEKSNGGDEEGKFVGAAVGHSHSVLISASGNMYAVGSNKVGQCGVNANNESIPQWKKCIFAKDGGNDRGSIKAVQAACGQNFTAVLTDEGHLYTCGLSEFGQLGNGETGEYFVTANKLAFANATKFERRTLFVQSAMDAGVNMTSASEEAKSKMVPLADSSSIVFSSIACGKNHTIAVEAPSLDNACPRVFSWGSGAYGCLGHGSQVDEYRPRLIASLRGPLFAANIPVRAAAGTICSMILTARGHVYYWGRHRNVGEATMRPTIVDALANNGHVVTALGAGSGTVFFSTNSGSTVSWGQGPHGELGYGDKGGKSSAKPLFVDKLDKCIVTDVSCGYGHTLFLLRDKDAEDNKAVGKLKKLEECDLKQFIKECESAPEIQSKKK